MRLLLTAIFVLAASVAAAEPALVVTGNTTYSMAQISARMKQFETPLLDKRGAIDTAAVRNRASLIAAFYAARGFQRVKVVPAIDRVNHRIDIVVTEGPRYRVGTIRITGQLIETEGEQLARLNVRRGDAWRGDRVWKAIQQLRQFYVDRGYPSVSVNPRTKVEHATQTIDVHIAIELQ